MARELLAVHGCIVECPEQQCTSCKYSSTARQAYCYLVV
jgi:hypothetical protein